MDIPNRCFSIITPSLNQLKFIEQTIQSVLNQVGNFFIDYIIADGGSSDGSIEIIKKYDNLIKSKKYPVKCKGIKFRWWSKPDNGQSSAINAGLRRAEGGILAWINSDDYYEDNVFEGVIEQFKNNPEVDLVYGNCNEVYENGGITRGESMQSDFKINLENGCLISQPAAFFTKRILNKIGMLDETLNYCMDYDLWLRILKESQGLFIDKALANFRVWEKSKTSQKPKEFYLEENKIRKKYKGSIINPGAVHRLRKKITFFEKIKKRTPNFYRLSKAAVYRIINIAKYK